MSYEGFYRTCLPDLKGEGEQRRATCPFCDHKEDLSVNIETGQAKCFYGGCLFEGDAFDFLMRLKGLSFPEAKEELRKYGISPLKDNPPPKKTKSKKKKPSLPDYQIQGYVKTLTDEAIQFLKEVRGISGGVIERYRIGYHKAKKRFAIPVMRGGECVNIRLYSPGQEPKILPISPGRSIQLYPEDQLKNEEVWLCEGETDALCGISHGLNCITVTGGAGSWRDEFTPLFKGKKVYIVYDCDEAGRRGAEKVAEILSRVAEVRIIDLGLGEGEDLTDWFVTHGKNTKDLLELIKTTPQFKKLTKQEKEIREEAKVIASKGMSLDELLKAKFEPEQFWVDKGLIPKNAFVILAGLKGRGKTTLTLQLALKLIKGDSTFLKEFNIHESPKVLYVFAENTKPGLEKILSTQTDAMNLNLTQKEIKRLHVQPREKINLMSPRGIAVFKELFSLYQPDLVIFDPIHRFTGGQDINKMAVINSLFDSLQAVNDNCTWFFVSHFRKPSPKDIDMPIYKIVGSSAFVNNCDTVIAIERAHQRRTELYNTLYFEVRRDRPIEPIDIYMNPDNRTMEVVSKTDIISGGVKVEDVVAVLGELKGKARPTIIVKLAADKYKVTERRIYELLKDAQEQGLVAKEKGKFGRWYVL